MATVNAVPNALAQFFDNQGKPLANGKVYFYLPGTSTPATTWQDPFQNVVNPNPVQLDANGRAPIFGIGPYRQVVYDQFGALIWDSNVSGIFTSNVSGVTSVFGRTGAVTAAQGDYTPSQIGTAAQGTELLGLSNLSTTGIVQRTGAGVYSTTSSELVIAVNGLSDLMAIPIATFGAVRSAVTQYRNSQGDGGGGTWSWLSGNQSALVSSDPGYGIYAPPTSDLSGASGCWARNFSGGMDVRWFGAKCDGVTDDAAAVGSAMTTAGNLGGAVVVLPQGKVCAVGSAVTIPSNVVFDLAGGTLMHLGTTLHTVLTSAKTATNVTVKNGSINGNTAAITSYATDRWARPPAMDMAGSNVTVSNVYIYSCRGPAISVNYNKGVSASNIVLNDNQISNIDSWGILVADCSNVVIQRNRIVNTVTHGIYVGAFNFNVDSVSIVGNYCDGMANDSTKAYSGLGITLFNGRNPVTFMNFLIDSNVCVNCQSIAYSITPSNTGADDSGHGSVTGNHAANTIAVGSGAGISYELIGNHIEFSGNSSLNPYNRHLSISGSYLSINDFNCVNNANGTLGSILYGIVINNGDGSVIYKDIDINGVYFVNTNPNLPTSGVYGIFFLATNPASPHQRFDISNVKMYGNILGGIYLTTAVTGLYIRNCKIDLSGSAFPVGYPVYIGNSSDIHISSNLLYLKAGWPSAMITLSPSGNPISGNLEVVRNTLIAGDTSNYGIHIAGTTTANGFFAENTLIGFSVNDGVLKSNFYNLASFTERPTNTWNYVTTAPATGYHYQGEWFYNINGVAGQPIGWICTAAGTPGTFKALANL